MANSSKPFDSRATARLWRNLIKTIGEITTAMNSCHWLIFEALRIVLKMDRDEATSFFYSLKSDSAQREFAVSIISDRLAAPEFSDLITRLKSEASNLGKKSGVRNGFIHTPWAVSTTGKLVVMDGAKPHPKLDMGNPIKQGKNLVADLYEARSRLTAICDELENAPLP